MSILLSAVFAQVASRGCLIDGGQMDDFELADGEGLELSKEFDELRAKMAPMFAEHLLLVGALNRGEIDRKAFIEAALPVNTALQPLMERERRIRERLGPYFGFIFRKSN